MKEPWFWREASLSARLISIGLSPLSAVYGAASKLRANLVSPYRVSPLVICIGNATLGGVGKTPFAIMLAQQLIEKGYSVAFLSKGYGARLEGPVQVDPQKHSFVDVGDEPLLLAARAPTWISKDRKAGIEAAAKTNPDVIIMDDGFQNPTIAKDFSILLLASTPPVNQKVFPAGPYREPIEEARHRADIVVHIGKADTTNEPDLQAFLEPTHKLKQTRYYAFCGIANPERFFQTLKQQGAQLAGQVSFPDHHHFAAKDIETLKKAARDVDATLITTAKDFTRIPVEHAEHIKMLTVEMKIDDPERLTAVIEKALRRKKESANA